MSTTAVAPQSEQSTGYNVVLVSAFVKQFESLLLGLKRGLQHSQHNCVAVITREGADGVIEMAKAANLPVFVFPNCVSLQRLMDKDQNVAEQVQQAIDELQTLSPDILCSWGYQILPACLIDLPAVNAVNFHFADLPKYRGGMSLAAQIIEGEAYTHLSLHELTVEIDAGGICAKSDPIALDGVYSQQALAKGIEVAGSLLANTLDDMQRNTLQIQPNDFHQPDLPHSWGVLREKVTQADGSETTVNKGYLGYLAIHWDVDSCEHIERACRAFDSMGGPFVTRIKDEQLLLVHFQHAEKINEQIGTSAELSAEPGDIVEIIDENTIVIQALDGQLQCQVFLNPQLIAEAFQAEQMQLNVGDRLVKAVSVSDLSGIKGADR